MQYSWPYVLVILVLIAFSFLWSREQDVKRKRYYTLASVAVLVFFLGFRGLISEDWPNYYYFFENCSFSDIESYFSGQLNRFEPGYTLFNIVVKSVFPNYFFLTFFISILDLVLMLRFAHSRVENVPLFLLLFLAFDGIAIFCNQYRNFISILIFLNALPYLEKRKPIPYFLLCLLSLTFHVSAILYFPLYFFFHKYPNKWLYLSFFIIFNILFLLHISIVRGIIGFIGLDMIYQSKIATYTDFYDASRLISIGFIERTITGLLIFFFYDRLKERRKGNGIYINAIIMYFFFIYIFGEFKEMSQRLSYLFLYGYWVIWMDLIESFIVRNNKRLFIFFVYMYCLLKISIMCRYPHYKYENILFGSSSYQERLYYYNRTKSNKDDN